MKFPKQVEADDRPLDADKALASTIRECDHVLALAAESANRSRDVRAVEREFGKLETEILEPWDNVPSR